MKKLLLIAIALLVILPPFTFACARGPETEKGGIAPPSVIVPAPAPAPMPAPRPESAAFAPSIAEERMIVRNGDMSLVVKDVIKARDETAQLAASFDGFVVSSQISGEEEEMRGWISIRVPDEKFDQTLVELRNLAVRVKSESTSSRDVTEEYIDLQARLRNAEATENQYLALLDRATEVEDILRIYDSLSRIRNEIEQIKGRIQYLERTTSMSLISVNLEPETTAKPLARAGWNALEVLKSAVRGIVVFGQWLGTLAIWLLIFIPIWGTILGIILWQRHRKKRAT